jgi:hypothetical protein
MRTIVGLLIFNPLWWEEGGNESIDGWQRGALCYWFYTP